MRVEPGRYRHVATNGVEINVDRPLSQEQADLLVAIIDRAGLTPVDVFAVEWDAEGPVIVDYLERGPDGHLQFDVVTNNSIVYGRKVL